MKLPRNYSRKDFRDKSLVGHLISYSEIDEIGYKVFFPEHKEVVIGIHGLFNKIILECSEIYYNKIMKLKIKVVEEESTVNLFTYLEALRYVNDANCLEYQNVDRTCGWCDEPIHVADVVRIFEMSTLQEVGNESWSRYGDTT